MNYHSNAKLSQEDRPVATLQNKKNRQNSIDPDRYSIDLQLAWVNSSNTARSIIEIVVAVKNLSHNFRLVNRAPPIARYLCIGRASTTEIVERVIVDRSFIVSRDWISVIFDEIKNAWYRGITIDPLLNIERSRRNWPTPPHPSSVIFTEVNVESTIANIPPDIGFHFITEKDRFQS